MALQQMALSIETNALQAPPATSPIEESGGALKRRADSFVTHSSGLCRYQSRLYRRGLVGTFFPGRRSRFYLFLQGSLQR